MVIFPLWMINIDKNNVFPPEDPPHLLLESGGDLLLESGGLILLEGN